MKNMKMTIKAGLAGAALGWLCLSTGLAQTPPANLSPDLQEVVKLSQQKMSDDIITSYIKNSGKTYKLGADDIIYLNGQGVSQAVIATLLQNSTQAGNPAGQPAPAPTPVTSAASPTDANSTAPQPPPVDASPAPEPATASSAPSTPAPAYAPVAPPPMFAPASAGFQDNFFADGGLNPGLWQTQSGLLSSLASLSGPQVLPELAFTPSGMQMSGIRREGQFMGIQSTASFVPPFNFNVTVTGLDQNAIPFEIYLMSADLQQWVSIAGHLGGRGERPHAGLDVGGGFHHEFGVLRIPLGGESRSPEYGVWVNHTGSGQPIAGLGYKVFENPIAGLPYTVQVSLGGDGLAAVTLLDAGRGVVAAQNVPVGTGPFYVVLAGRDGMAYANWQSVQLASSAPVMAVTPVAAPAPPAVPTLDYFQSQLSPYGNWVTLPQYGLCWQPAVTPGWRPYFDGGSWTYTDAGWYWQSVYPWGDIAFHYGRWAYTFSGWVWVPGYDYAPAWVVWRHADEDGYVGWAPLVPGAVFIDGGWQYNGRREAADFDFGIGVGFFTFVAGDHFFDHDFRGYVVPRDRLSFVYGRSVYENHYRFDHGRYFNEGMDRDRMARLTHRDVRDIRPRGMEEIRHDEERRNVEVRRNDVRDFHAGVRPDARRTVEPAAHREVQPEARGAGEPARGGMEPAHGGMEPARGGVDPGHGEVNNGHAVPAPNQKASPQGGQKGGNGQDKEKKPNN